MAAPPCFLRVLPTETDATDGDIVTFQVKVSSEPSDPTVVSWWRCGEALRPVAGHREMIAHEDGWHELILSNVTEGDEGEYECRAENHRGHNSCFGSLFYYQEGGGTLTDVTMEGMAAEDGRQSGLLILIDDGSHTEEESLSGQSDRKSMTVSEQMQGIIEDLTQSDRTAGSLTLEKEDDNQFCSDIEDLCDDDLEANVIQNILGMSSSKQQGSEATLIPEMPSPDLLGDVAYSEGASDPYAPSAPSQRHRWSSNPNDVSKRKKEKEQAKEKQAQGVWPPEPSGVTFYLPPDTTVTTSVDLPYTRDSSATEEEEAPKSWRCADTPFDVADITEEAVDVSTSSKDEGSLRQSPLDGTTRDAASAGEAAVVLPQTSDSRVASRIDTSLTSVSQISGEAIPSEGCQQNKMSFTRSSFKATSFHYTDDGVMDSTSVQTTSVTSRMSSSFYDEEQQQRTTRRELEDDSFSFSSKKTRLASAYEADESSLSTSHRAGRTVADSFVSEAITESKGGLDVYVAIMDFKPMGSDEEAVAMKEGQRVEIVDASKPRRWLVRTVPMGEGETPQEGWVPACYLEKSTALDTLSSYVVTEADMDPKELEAMQNREAIVKELVETEEDFAKDMQFVVENYYKQMDNPRLPKEFRDRKGSVFGNFKDICDFHNNVLMKGVNYHATQPTKLGKTFLRLERDFDMHANYCWNEARAQRLLQEGALRDFFDDHSRMIDDDKLLTDHLKLPIQRLNDYQLLLKELIKYSGRLGEDTADLQKALDFIHSINTRTKDLQYIQVIEGCKGDLLKIGRILKHEVFDVCEGGEVSASERYVFLFKGRVFVTEKRCTGDKEAYHVTNLFRLQDVEMIESVEGDALKIVFKSHKKSRPGFPLSLRARSPEQKTAWIKELHAANQVVEDLGDLEPRLEHPLVASDEHLSEKPSDAAEQALEEKPALKRQDSVKKPTKTPESSAPQTPSDTDGVRPPLKKQESFKKSKRKPSDASPPETPTEVLEKPPKLLRQDSKKGKASDTSAPETPTEASDKRPKLSRQDSKKSKVSDSSAPQTPVETSEKPPSLSRQESKKSKASDTSAPETPVESSEKPPSLSRQESKKSKVSDTSAPETPVEISEKPPSLSRQESKKSKASDTSAPETPVESSEKPPSLSRQESKKSKASDTSAPETPVETSEKPPSLSRQESKKSKASDTSAPETPVESSEKPPPFSRQESKKSKGSDPSAPQTPVESTEKPPPLSRQESKKSEASAPETPTESKEPKLSRQDSKKSAPETPTDSTATAPALTRQDSVKKKQKKQSVTEKEAEKAVPIAEEKEKQESLSKKEAEDKEKPKQGEETCAVPTIVMSEDASGSEARMESMELGDDSATLASESLRSISVTPPGSGAYEKPSLPSSTSSLYHMLILVPLLCACYVFTQFWSIFADT